MRIKVSYWRVLSISYVLFISMFIISCSHRTVEDKFVRNIDMKITSINGETVLSDDKFHKPETCNTILLETIDGPKQYRELNTCKLHSKIHIDNVWIYNHRVGDIVHFDFLLKSKFFEIKERE
jgi:hypothetical protein